MNVKNFARRISATLCFILLYASNSFAVSNSANVPVLLYHSWDVSGCTPDTNQSMRLEEDLKILHQNGYTVVPAYWIAQWAIGHRDGSTLPNKIVGITFDDGANEDFYDNTIHGCDTKSFHTVLQEFKNSHSLPWYSPHAATFVIGSPVARTLIEPAATTHTGRHVDLDDTWWSQAQNSSVMEVYNHGTDHGHAAINGPVAETHPSFSHPVLFSQGLSLPISQYSTLSPSSTGPNNFFFVDNDRTAYAEIRMSGDYIKTKIGVYPDLFAYPFGSTALHLWSSYFPTKFSQHKTYAAFTTQRTYVTRNSHRYLLGRFDRGGNFVSTADLLQILANSGQ